MRKGNKKIPCGAFGLEGAANLINALGNNASGISSLVSQFTNNSSATNTGSAVGQSVQQTLGGLATGASIGTAIAPGIGTLVGGAAGLVTGLVGSSGSKAQMTSFTDYDEGTLGTGLIGAFKNSSLRKRRREIKKNAYNNRAAVANTANLQEDYDYMQVDASAMGGEPMSLAYLDDGEVLQTPDGQLSQIPEQGNPTDSNLEVIPRGTRVLSDKLKVPGTNKTFAKTMEDYVKVRKTKGTDMYAQNAQKLNQMNQDAMYDKLFNMQEEMKRKKGIKKKYKNLVPAQADGDGNLLPEVQVTTPYITPIAGGAPWASLMTSSIDNTPISAQTANEWTSAINAQNKRIQAEEAQQRRANRKENLAKIGNSLNSLGTAAASLAPIISNLTTDKAETYAPAYNPYESTARRLMRRRRVRTDDAERALRRQQAISRYNANQYNTSTGANLAYAAATSSDLRQQLASMYLQAEDMNAQYDSQRAEMLSKLGQDRVNAYNLARDVNMRNRAATRNIRRQGLSQLSQWAQAREYMRNQTTRDNAMLALYGPLLDSYDSDTRSQFDRWIRRGGNYGS